VSKRSKTRGVSTGIVGCRARGSCQARYRTPAPGSLRDAAHSPPQQPSHRLGNYSKGWQKGNGNEKLNRSDLKFSRLGKDGESSQIERPVLNGRIATKSSNWVACPRKMARPEGIEPPTLCLEAGGREILNALSSIAYWRKHSETCPTVGPLHLQFDLHHFLNTESKSSRRPFGRV